MKNTKEAAKKWRVENRAAIAAYGKEYYARNKNRIRRAAKTHYGTFRGYICHLVTRTRSRCINPKDASYERYGGRGICCLLTVRGLYDWLVEKGIDPRGLCIHRIDNDGDYSLTNITFLSTKEHVRVHVDLRKVARLRQRPARLQRHIAQLKQFKQMVQSVEDLMTKNAITIQEVKAYRLCHHSFEGLSTGVAAVVMGLSQRRIEQLLCSLEVRAPQLFPILTVVQARDYHLYVVEGWTLREIAIDTGRHVSSVGRSIIVATKKGMPKPSKRNKLLRYEANMDTQVKEKF